MKELDNKKMWESILFQMKKTVNPAMGQINIVRALKDQGFEFKDGEIVEIEENQNFKIEAGKWYMCIKELANYTVGNIYCCLVDNLLESDIETPQHVQMLSKYFRPATEEEIAAHKSDTEILPEVTEFYRNTDICWSEEEAEKYAIKHPSQRMTSAKAKEEGYGKVEPKFKVGDFIINTNYHGNPIYKIYGIDTECYLCSSVDNVKYSNRMDFAFDNPYLRLWTIEDAKDGDVLTEESCIFIFKKWKEGGCALVHCCLFDDGDFSNGCTLSFDKSSTYPATKEQRDLLFDKMKEAGYEWDIKKKKLKKISSANSTDSQELTEFEQSVRDIITTELCNSFGDVSFGVSISNDEAKLIAKKLLPFAKKELLGKVNISKIVADYPYSYEREIGYRKGVEDTLNKLWE